MIGLEDVRAAAARIEGQVLRTPFLRSQVLSGLTGALVFVKFENHQFTGSFKDRGSLNKLLSLDAQARAGGVCAMSAGNHAQGVAWNAKRLGIPATIVMPRATPLTKVEHTRDHGANVVLFGDSLDEAAQEAHRIAQENGLAFVHPYDDAWVIAGQGTVGLEMLEGGEEVDAIIAPVGGGGLLSGVATVSRALRPSVKLYGVQAASYATFVRGAHDGPRGVTIADGIAVKSPGALTREIIDALVDDVLVVDEPVIEQSVALFINVEKTVAEGAGAAPLACLLQHPHLFAGKRVGLIVSGGNIDARLLASVLMRELVREQRIVCIRVSVADQPGFLADAAGLIAAQGANIIEVRHDRSLLTSPAREASMDMTLETRGPEQARQVLEALRGAGYRAAQVD
ncbi:MAG: putative threonine dehydratase [Hyphomicrobiales bacterium]|nr:putative threonine dehydratase [Hyphomicrobiales bacterium]